MVRPTSKKCPICGKNKKFSAYYTHRNFTKEYGYDEICKSCAQGMATSKEGMMEYCSTTLRLFREELWIWCENKVTTTFKEDAIFNSLTEIQQEKKLIERIISTYFSQMNQSQWYIYTPNEFDSDNEESDAVENYEDEDIDDELINKKSNKKKYSSKWGGDFTSEELGYLEDQLKGSQDDYELKTKNDFEYAMNVAVSGLIVRKARKDYLNGEVGSDKRYKESVATYDSLCTSAKFNQKTRTENSNTGLGSFGETFKRLEEMGFQAVQVKFPKDDVDIILEEYAHSHVALRGALDDVE